MIQNNQYPKISIITPSFNQGEFIEETIQSVLSQEYPNLEYIIIDGGSTDQTVDIIKKYSDQITYWVSEPDNGQTHAINKGLKKATGDIIAYINSDDSYLSGSLFKVAQYFTAFPETDLLHGKCRYINQQGEKIGEQFGNIRTIDEIFDLWNVWWKERQFVQPEVFWSRRIFEKIGFFNESLYYVMDYEYWCRILLAGGNIGSLDESIACFRFTEDQKSNNSEDVAIEQLNVIKSWLWDNSIPISWGNRLILQGQWLYQVVLLKQIEDSIESKDKKVVRWIKSILIILSNPQILLLRKFHERLTLVKLSH